LTFLTYGKGEGGLHEAKEEYWKRDHSTSSIKKKTREKKKGKRIAILWERGCAAAGGRNRHGRRESKQEKRDVVPLRDKKGR